MSVTDLSGKTASEVDKIITGDSCLVFVYMNGCGACEMFKPVFTQASGMGSLLAGFYCIESNSPGVQAVEKHVQKLGKEIEGFPSTLIMCNLCGKNGGAQCVDLLVGTRSLDVLLARATEMCPPMKK